MWRYSGTSLEELRLVECFRMNLSSQPSISQAFRLLLKTLALISALLKVQAPGNEINQVRYLVLEITKTACLVVCLGLSGGK
jgi:hypothetical protein